MIPIGINVDFKTTPNYLAFDNEIAKPVDDYNWKNNGSFLRTICKCKNTEEIFCCPKN